MKRHVRWFFLIGAALVITMSGCGGGGSDDDPEISNPNPVTDPAEPSPIEELAPAPSTTGFLALVTTPADGVIANATIGDLGVTSATGVASGSSEVAADQWLKVSAPGYAPDYVRAVGPVESTLVYEATLTPVDAQAVYQPGSSLVMQNDPDSPTLEMTLGSDVFDRDEVYLEMTAIDPTTLGTLRAGSDEGTSLYPQVAFALEARDASGNEVAFAPGKTVTVKVKDDALLGDPPLLAWFNPESGLWGTEANACSRLDANWITCELSHFSTHSGMGPDAPASSEDSYNGARSRLQDALADWAENGGGTPSQEVLDALDELAAQAEALADQGGEVAKQRLLAVTATAQQLGQDAVAERMEAAAKDVAAEIAQELITNPECGRLREMLQSMAQCQLLGVYPEAEDLDDKIRELLQVCNNWHGTITYTMTMESPYPDYEMPDLTKHSGPTTWTEFHEVVLSINPETLNIQGDDVVSTVFPEVAYRAPEDSGDCNAESYLELKNMGSPAYGDLFLLIDGNYQPGERPQFTLGTPAKGSGSNSISLNWSMYVRMFDDECNLEEVGPNEMATVPNYLSMLVGLGQSPPITLQEMLNTGYYFDHGEFEIIKGRKQVDLNPSALGVWPFTKATVQWHFVQDKPALEEVGTE